MAAPATRASIPPERAPAGCDWLIQTHLQRNASLRVPVGVQFKSAAPGAWGQAGAGSEDDSCTGAFPKAAVGFLKRVFRTGENACQEYPLWVQRSSPQSLRRRASPFPILLQPDFGREQNPKRPVGFHHTPPRPRARKVKIWGEDIATCHPRSPKGSGTRAGLPPRLRPPPSVLFPPPQARGSPGLQPPGGVRPAKVQGDCKRGTCAGIGAVVGRPRRGPAARSAGLTASLRVRRSHLESGHQAHLRRRRLRSARGCLAECPPVGPGSGSRRGRGGAGAPRGRVGEEEEEGGAGALRKGPPGRGAPSFSRFPANY